MAKRNKGNGRIRRILFMALILAAAFRAAPCPFAEPVHAAGIVRTPPGGAVRSDAPSDRPAPRPESSNGKTVDVESSGEKKSSPADGQGAAAKFERNRWNYVEDSMDVSKGIPEDAEGRLARIRETGRLRVATEPYYSPQEFIDPSLSGQAQYVGADIELARLIAFRMGVELEIVPLEFAEVISQTSDGGCDLAISGLAYTPARSNILELSKGYHYAEDNVSTGILIRREDRERIRSAEDLADRDIAAQIGSLQEALAAENLGRYRQFIRFSNMDRVYRALEDGEVDAAAVDIETARHHMESDPSCGLMFLEGVRYSLDEPFQGDRVAAPPGEIQLISFVNGVIDEVLESGKYEKWFNDYMNYAAGLGL